MDHSFWGGGIMMWFIWIPVLIILIVLLFRLVDFGNKSANKESPIDILKKRYAKGEISKEEFEEMKKDMM